MSAEVTLYRADGRPVHEQILADLIKLRKAIGGLVAEKKAGGPNFPVKSAKDLAIKLRKAADEVGMPIAGAVVKQKVTHLPRPLDRNGQETGTAIHVVTTVRFESADGSFREFVGSGHALDAQDKAGGKASTYSWKDAVTKGLSLPDKEMVDTDDEGGLSEEKEDVIPKSTPKKNTPRTPANVGRRGFLKRG